VWLFIRACFVWLVIIAAESIQGTLRRLLTADDLPARQIGVLAGALVVLAIAFLTLRQLDLQNTREAIAVGAIWVALTVAFDVALGAMTGASWDRIASDFDVLHGGMLPFGLAVMLFAPLIARRLRGRP
jgi:hypothetical protein